MEATLRKVPIWVLVAYAALILARMFLTSRDEIIPWGADSATFAAATTHDLWFGQERGGVAFLASVARHLGLPFKLAFDAAYVGLCLLAARRIARATASEPAALVALFLLAFSSYFLRAPLIFLSDPATACLVFAAVLVFSPFLECPVSRWRWCDAALAGVVLALWALTRREELIIYGSFALLVIAVLLLHRFRWHEGWNRRALLLLVPLVLMLGTGEAVRLRNLAVHHVSAQSRYSGPGSAALLSALYSIPPDRELRFCPVTNATFESAASVSPTLQPLLPLLLYPQNPYRLYAADRYHIPGEVCTWLNFVLHDAYGTAYSLDDGTADQAMLRTAREIRAAQAAGKLGRRTTFYPADPLWRQWLPELPRALIWGTYVSLGLHYDVISEPRASRETEVLPLAVERDFADGLLLRSSLTEAGELVVGGTLREAKPATSADYVLLREKDAVIAASPIYPFTDFMHLARFNITTHPLVADDAMTLEFWKSGQLVQSLPLPAFGSTATQLGGAETWDVSTGPATTPPPLADRVKKDLVSINGIILMVGLLAVFVLALVRARNEAPAHRFELAALALTSLCFLLPRIGFYALLDVWLRWDSLRYFSANSGAAFIGLISAVIWFGASLGARRAVSGIAHR